ncbi:MULTISPECIES: universal stress protein [Heyndrickxia]|uniref:Universal stress protein n=1 Tax=Heyndrickxia shackletonii TaxID=157838 RepID=A0A0Q3WZL4_9BACI|nr:universal stress protein [Heyndrickxia shackletonii]KQL54903.1 universal stress protein [Heyndrickxia shackletonii]MBB2483256.1 universal stress protein [Bacillus sp. APMAM]NEY99430.1 universal stress protein [Heyndrickxia shackletonii]RTZ53319.1 universal stress protein [Bacillus sp. SAJ1]
MYNKILVAFDGSAASARALHHAAKLGKTVGTEKLTILHVNREIPMPEPALNIDLDQLLDEENQEILTPAIQFLSESNVNYEVHTFHGEPAHVIINYASEHHYDVIVMGSRGKGLIKEALLGSVSNKVAHSAHCPVLIVK